jgi:hypothetical protein
MGHQGTPRKKCDFLLASIGDFQSPKMLAHPCANVALDGAFLLGFHFHEL